MHKRSGVLLPFALAVGALMIAAAASSAQLSQTTPPTLPISFTTSGDVLMVGTQAFLTNPASTREELPELGHKFELLGTMVQDTDFEYSTGDGSAVIAGHV